MVFTSIKKRKRRERVKSAATIMVLSLLFVVVLIVVALPWSKTGKVQQEETPYNVDSLQISSDTLGASSLQK